MDTVGILVGGGPAPGINAVIGAAVIEAINRGMRVIGFYDGFKWLASEEFDADKHTIDFTINDVARIHFEGGSMLRTSRTSLIDDARLKVDGFAAANTKKVVRVLTNLTKQGVNRMITIGGDDTSLSARFLCDVAADQLRVVHVPKTIDNDLPLPHDVPTFGFSTARFVGTQLVKNLMRDSQTTGRWYLCEAMGRTAGFLALGIGMSAGATITLIPEEFPDRIKVETIVDHLECSILKRRIMGRPDGVAIVAEGLAYRLGDKDELERLLGHEVPLDAAGHPRLSEVNIGALLKRQLEARFKARGQSLTIVDHELGYELRSADPTPNDMSYCRSLGYFAVELLQQASTSHVMAALVNGNLQPISLHDLIDPKTNRTRTRTVDTRSDSYRVARAYMIRLEPSDLENPEMLAKLATEAKMSPDEFKQRYAHAASHRMINGAR
ncbi:MAG: 6-phosphofructokinase [Phycisphaerae bacterium]